MAGTLTSLGKNSKTTYLVADPGRPYIEFTAAATIKNGQPVKLANDGRVTPWAKTDALSLLIGHAYTQNLESVAADETVTIITRASAVIYGMSSAALNAGPITWSSYDSSTEDDGGNIGYNVYEAAGANTAMGWLLDQTTGANEVARILLL